MTDGLDPAQERTWALLLGAMMWVPGAIDQRLEATAGIGHADYQVLRWISRSTGAELHMTRLAATANVTPSHLSRIVARLESRGLIARSASPDNARYVHARITDAGADTVARVEPLYAAIVRDLVFDRLDAERTDQLDAIAEVLLSHVKSECAALVPPRKALSAPSPSRASGGGG